MRIIDWSSDVCSSDLKKLGYGDNAIEEIVRYAVGNGTLVGAPGINHATLKAKGFTSEALDKLEQALASAFDIKFAFNKWTLGEEFCIHTLKIPQSALDDFGFDMLALHEIGRAHV